MAIVYVAADDERGNELWVADGDFSNCRLLKDISAGFASSDPTNLTALPDGRVLFVATDQIHGRELWITDGTGAGTRMLRDIGTGDGTEGPENLTALPDGRVVFTADDGVHGRELWVTDGTAGGTVLLADVTAGEDGTDFRGFHDLGNGRILFSDAYYGASQWATDGTPEGTVELGSLMSYPPEDGIMNLSVRYDGEGRAWFPGQRIFENTVEVAHLSWTTDGTLEGTYRVDAPEAPSSSFYRVGDQWISKYFLYEDGPRGAPTQYIGVTGETGSTLLLPEAIGGSGSSHRMAQLDDERVVMPMYGNDLWVSDGTLEGTYAIAEDILKSEWQLDFLSLGNGKVLFSVTDFEGADLWVTDGSAAGTFQIAPYARWTPQALPATATLLDDGSVLFAAATGDGNSEAVWRVNFWEGGLERVEGVQHWTGDAIFEVARLESDLWTGGG
ncbi:hypothetical protein BKE38_06985 [Pseudoroseomonas deserti]|uniref:Hyalin n=1 Tax=Teichococcus deserti TaxID=1817963 RepID=A0A1V2H5S7_9PROT|nr:hypothetical protein [Pseudoroseomonas deserti]ONG56067.1 hypothetical protein BKE38_06985 [Pseudoroseomonas deserti]